MMMLGSFARRFAALVAALACCVSVSAAWAQGADGRPLRLVVPNQAGSGVDALARAISHPLAEAMGRPVVVENLPGAGGVTGTMQIVRAPADGLTLGLVSSNHAINPFVYKSMPFDSYKDITPISVIASVPLVLVVNNEVPAKTAGELISWLKARPGQVNYGSAGNGTVLHLAAELFAHEAGVEVRHVPYKGTGTLVTDLIGGHVQTGFLAISAAAPQVRSGKLRAIAVSTSTRSAMLPEVPTLAESGLPNYVFDAWIAMIGPAGLPAQLTGDLAARLKSVLDRKDVQDVVASQGMAIVGSGPDEARGYLKSELDKHGRIVERAGAKAE